MLTPAPSSIADYIKSAELSLDEAEAIQTADSKIRDNMANCAIAFIELASNVRPDVLYQFGALYGLSRDALEATVRQGAAGIKALQADAKTLIRNTVLAMRQEGKTQQQIADATGIALTQVNGVLALSESESANTPSIDCRSKADAEQAEEVLQRHAAGESQGAIAESIGISRPRVNQIVNGKTGHESKPKARAPIPEPVKAQILQNLLGGESVKDIAQRHGVSRNAVERIRRDAGKASAAPMTPTQGRTIEHSDRYHSPSLARLRDPATPEALSMASYRQQFMTAVVKTINDLESAEKRMRNLQRAIQEDNTKYHGSMVARWAAYEKVWADEMIETIGSDTFAGVPQIIQGKLKDIHRCSGQFLSTLDLMKTVPYTIEK